MQRPDEARCTRLVNRFVFSWVLIQCILFVATTFIKALQSVYIDVIIMAATIAVPVAFVVLIDRLYVQPRQRWLLKHKDEVAPDE